MNRRRGQRRQSDRLRAFVLDWHTGATIVVGLLSAAMLIGVISATRDRTNSHRDVHAAIVALERKDTKIDGLGRRVAELDAALAALHDDRSVDRAEIARLTAERDALQQQLVILRRRPVVPIATTTTTRPATTTTTRPATTTTTRPATTTTTRPATTTTTRPATTTTTTGCRLNGAGRCIIP